jgi:hypothetical protein
MNLNHIFDTRTSPFSRDLRLISTVSRKLWIGFPLSAFAFSATAGTDADPAGSETACPPAEIPVSPVNANGTATERDLQLITAMHSRGGRHHVQVIIGRSHEMHSGPIGLLEVSHGPG